MSKKIPGQTFLRALSFALRACPTDDAGARMQHVAFVGDKIVCSDGDRWHVGFLPEGFAFKRSFVTARLPAVDLIRGLEYGYAMAKRSGAFSVKMGDGVATIEYGKKQIDHDLDPIDLGPIPARWTPPVADDAPGLSAEQADLSCDSLQDAMKWYKSWDKDKGVVKLFGLGGNNPIRIDIVANGDLVARAYVLPVGRAPAQLPDDQPLLDRASKGERRGQSILDLIVSDRAADPVPEVHSEALPEGDKRKKRAKKRKAEAEEEASPETA